MPGDLISYGGPLINILGPRYRSCCMSFLPAPTKPLQATTRLVPFLQIMICVALLSPSKQIPQCTLILANTASAHDFSISLPTV